MLINIFIPLFLCGVARLYMIECHSHVTCILSSFNSSSAIVTFFQSYHIYYNLRDTFTNYNNFRRVILSSDISSVKMCKIFIRLILKSRLNLVYTSPLRSSVQIPFVITVYFYVRQGAKLHNF